MWGWGFFMHKLVGQITERATTTTNKREVNWKMWGRGCVSASANGGNNKKKFTEKKIVGKQTVESLLNNVVTTTKEKKQFFFVFSCVCVCVLGSREKKWKQ
jgi:hypothetical protein